MAEDKAMGDAAIAGGKQDVRKSVVAGMGVIANGIGVDHGEV